MTRKLHVWCFRYELAIELLLGQISAPPVILLPSVLILLKYFSPPPLKCASVFSFQGYNNPTKLKERYTFTEVSSPDRFPASILTLHLLAGSQSIITTANITNEPQSAQAERE